MKTFTASKFRPILMASVVGIAVVPFPDFQVSSRAIEQKREAIESLWAHGVNVRQSTRTTCGPAALATLVRYSTGEAISESQALAKTRPSSLWDLRHAAARKGVQARSYEMSVAWARRWNSQTGAPMIAHLQTPRPHFVVVTGYKDGRALVCDPAEGNRAWPISELELRSSGRWLVPTVPGAY